VTATLSPEFLEDSRHNGIDVPTVLRTSIDRMLRVAGQERGDFKLGVQIMNPDSCDFHVKIVRID
jgi:hypothetical protein